MTRTQWEHVKAELELRQRKEESRAQMAALVSSQRTQGHGAAAPSRRVAPMTVEEFKARS